MLVVDTSVIAMALLGDAKSSERIACRTSLEREATISVPELFFAEFANVTWKYVSAGLMSHDLARGFMNTASDLLTHVVSNGLLWHRALELAIEHNHAVYDMLFVALADVEGTRLLTLDKKLRRKLPRKTCEPG